MNGSFAVCLSHGSEHIWLSDLDYQFNAESFSRCVEYVRPLRINPHRIYLVCDLLLGNDEITRVAVNLQDLRDYEHFLTILRRVFAYVSIDLDGGFPPARPAFAVHRRPPTTRKLRTGFSNSLDFGSDDLSKASRSSIFRVLFSDEFPRSESDGVVKPTFGFGENPDLGIVP